LFDLSAPNLLLKLASTEIALMFAEMKVNILDLTRVKEAISFDLPKLASVGLKTSRT
jgi:hypothetical protein